MNYKLKNIFTGDILETVLNNRGIKNHYQFLHPQFFNVDTSNILAMQEAVKLFIENINKKMLILVDSDADGYTSSAIIYSFAKDRFNCQIDYYVHNKKEHGLNKDVLSYVKNNNIKFLIIPDAGTNNKKEIAELIKNGVEVLVIDHHNPEKDKNCKDICCLVNNQIEKDLNSEFTGASLAYLFIEAVSKKMELKEPKEFLDLMAIGTIADTAMIVDPDIRGYVYEGKKQINNLFVKSFVNDEQITNYNISWQIAPIINSVTRFGSLSERVLLFQALTYTNDDGGIIEILKRKKNKETGKFDKVMIPYNFIDYSIEMLKKCKANQDKQVKNHMKLFVPSKQDVQIFILNEKDGTTGLVANKIKNLTNCPAIVLFKDENGLYTGSGRGCTEVFSDFQKWCSETGLFKLAQGHPNAFGVEIEESNFEKLEFFIQNLKVKRSKKRDTYYVDNIYDFESLSFEHMKTIAEVGDIWGTGCDEPIFAVKDVIVSRDSIFWKRQFLRLVTSKTVFVKGYTSKEEFENLTKTGFGDKVILDAIVKFKKNEYNNQVFYQAELIDYEIKEIINSTQPISDDLNFFD